MLTIGEVLAMIMRRFSDAYLGETLLKHLNQTKGRGRYQEVPDTQGNPWQFVYFDEQGSDTGNFVGLATHMPNPQAISFGPKHDNRNP